VGAAGQRRVCVVVGNARVSPAFARGGSVRERGRTAECSVVWGKGELGKVWHLGIEGATGARKTAGKGGSLSATAQTEKVK